MNLGKVHCKNACDPNPEAQNLKKKPTELKSKKLTQTTKLCFDLLESYKHIDMNQSKCKIFFNDKYKQHIFS
jgi:hypothetical protein